jgi:hypothetical protein
VFLVCLHSSIGITCCFCLCGLTQPGLLIIYMCFVWLLHLLVVPQVFVNAVSAVRRVGALLKLLGLPAVALHAQQQQRQRLKALDRFKSHPHGVLVATDVAARGLDIPNVQVCSVAAFGVGCWQRIVCPAISPKHKDMLRTYADECVAEKVCWLRTACASVTSRLALSAWIAPFSMLPLLLLLLDCIVLLLARLWCTTSCRRLQTRTSTGADAQAEQAAWMAWCW